MTKEAFAAAYDANGHYIPEAERAKSPTYSPQVKDVSNPYGGGVCTGYFPRNEEQRRSLRNNPSMREQGNGCFIHIADMLKL